MEREAMISFIERVVNLPDGHILQCFQQEELDLPKSLEELEQIYNYVWLMLTITQLPKINSLTEDVMECVLYIGDKTSSSEDELIMFCDSSIYLNNDGIDFTKGIEIITKDEISGFFYDEDQIWKFGRNYKNCYNLVHQRVTEYVEEIFEGLCE